MGSSTFKSVAFGGFDKQDVVRYIEESAKEHAEAVRRLQAEKAELSSTLESLSCKYTFACSALVKWHISACRRSTTASRTHSFNA